MYSVPSLSPQSTSNFGDDEDCSVVGSSKLTALWNDRPTGHGVCGVNIPQYQSEDVTTQRYTTITFITWMDIIH